MLEAFNGLYGERVDEFKQTDDGSESTGYREKLCCLKNSNRNYKKLKKTKKTKKKL